jgi:hypothetical protein
MYCDKLRRDRGRRTIAIREFSGKIGGVPVPLCHRMVVNLWRSDIGGEGLPVGINPILKQRS